MWWDINYRSLWTFKWLEKQCVAIARNVHRKTYITNLLIAYTQKAYKSLEAFNFFKRDHVQNVLCISISSESDFCCVKTKVTGKTHIHMILKIPATEFNF